MGTFRNLNWWEHQQSSKIFSIFNLKVCASTMIRLLVRQKIRVVTCKPILTKMISNQRNFFYTDNSCLHKDDGNVSNDSSEEKTNNNVDSPNFNRYRKIVSANSYTPNQSIIVEGKKRRKNMLDEAIQTDCEKKIVRESLLFKSLGKHISKEVAAYYEYFSKYTWFQRPDIALRGFAQYFYKNGEEELLHAKKIADYLALRGCSTPISFRIIPAPK